MPELSGGSCEGAAPLRRPSPVLKRGTSMRSRIELTEKEYPRPGRPRRDIHKYPSEDRDRAGSAITSLSRPSRRLRDSRIGNLREQEILPVVWRDPAISLGEVL